MHSALSGKSRKWPLPLRKGPYSMRALLLWLLLAAAGPLCAQSITLSVKEAPFESVLRQVGVQSGHQLVYTHETVQKGKTVSLTLRRAPLRKALDRLFEGQPLTYLLQDGHIIVKAREEKQAVATTYHVSGTVTDEAGTPLDGATVSISGTSRATATDASGYFILRNIDPAATLLISSVGYQTQTIELNGQESLQVQLTPTVNTLDETVVIAYGRTTRRFNTGSVIKVGAHVLAHQPVSNPLQALQGRVSGLFIQTQNGLPGGNIKVQLRGQGSVAAGNDPLYIVDGVPFISTPLSGGTLNGASGPISPLNSINPADIESIEVLKDADATALYGSRGANGVILITTKSGRVGKTSLDLSVQRGYSRVSRLVDYLDLDEYLAIRREAFKNSSTTPTEATAPDLLVWDTTRATDWQRYIFGRSVPLTTVQANLSGGSPATRFLFSTNYRREGVVLPGNHSYERKGGHLRVDHRSESKKLEVGFNTLYTVDKNELPYDASVESFITLPPHFPVYLPDGSFNFTTGMNPEALLQRTSTAETDHFLANSRLTVHLLKDLAASVNLGYTRLQLEQVSVLPRKALNPAYNPVSSSIFGNNRHHTFIAEPQVTYTRKTGKAFWNVLAGSSWQKSVRQGQFISGSNYTNDDLLGNLGAAGTIDSKSNTYVAYKYISAFGRLNVRWAERYLLNLNIRRDGSSRFGSGRRFGNFGAAGAGWIFSEERWIKKALPFLHYGKLRGSLGLTGNDQITDYGYLPTYSNSGTYQGISGLAPTLLANPAFGWETNRKMEGAIELGLFKSRLLLTANYYVSKSGNQLVPYPVPSVSGFTQYWANLDAEVENRGWEVELQSRNLETSTLKWNSALNLSFPQNRLVAYPGLAASSFANTYVVGKDLSVVKLLHFTGADPQTGQATYEDVSKDGQITTPADYIVAGKTSPDLFGGFNNNLSYKGWSLDFTFQFVQQHSLGSPVLPGLSVVNTVARAFDRWQQPGEITRIPAPTRPGTPAYTALLKIGSSTAVFYNTSYVRLKNASLAYSLPQRWLNRLGIRQGKLYLDGQNLWTFASSAFNDPETLNGVNPSIPPMRFLMGGIQLTF